MPKPVPMLERFYLSDTALRHFGERDLQEAVCLNLRIIFSEQCLPEQRFFDEFPEACDTGLGMGIRTPRLFANAQEYIPVIERAVRLYEPRLLERSVKIIPLRFPAENPQAFLFQACWPYAIQAKMDAWGVLCPVRFLAIFDLETGRAGVEIA